MRADEKPKNNSVGGWELLVKESGKQKEGMPLFSEISEYLCGGANDAVSNKDLYDESLYPKYFLFRGRLKIYSLIELIVDLKQL